MKRIACIVLFAATQALAQSYPSKPVKLLVGVPPGGPTDTVARAIAPELGEALGQPIVIENRPGASAVIATDAVAKAAPDGHTLAFIYITHATNPTLIAKLPYDTLRDFAPVSLVGRQSMVLLAHPAFAASSVPELLAAAKAAPGKIDYGASDPGSAPHLAAELFKMMAGIDLTPVYYKGTAPALHIPVMFVSNISALPHVKAGKLKGLAVTGAQRTTLAPGIPTLAESGLAGYEAYGWYGVAAPARTPAAVIARLHAEVARIAQNPAMKARLGAQGLELVGNSPPEFDAFIRAEIAKWSAVLKAAGIKPG
ncbi:MAG: tripartite tricarboxylate transporter substrate binding protein [Betaproteobacteria bacterium]|nr:MAG: tripartite tricarboxylate transporter substrate binding protein [Betaproteobacteria bacterium]